MEINGSVTHSLLVIGCDEMRLPGTKWGGPSQAVCVGGIVMKLSGRKKVISLTLCWSRDQMSSDCLVKKMEISPTPCWQCDETVWKKTRAPSCHSLPVGHGMRFDEVAWQK